MTVTVEIVGVPVACGDGVKDTWREIAAWVSWELDRAFGDAVRVQYHDFFEAGCPALPANARLPVVLIDGEAITAGAKISLPAIRRALLDRGLLADRERSVSCPHANPAGVSDTKKKTIPGTHSLVASPGRSSSEPLARSSRWPPPTWL